MRTEKRCKNAFTLIEIMIVVLIIGILLGIAVPNFVRARERSRQQSCVANLKQIVGAHEQYLMTNNLTDSALGSHWRSPSDLVTDGFLKSEPICPSGGIYQEAGNSLGMPGASRYRCTTYQPGGGGGVGGIMGGGGGATVDTFPHALPDQLPPP